LTSHLTTSTNNIIMSIFNLFNKPAKSQADAAAPAHDATAKTSQNQTNEPNNNADKAIARNVYNLIILDESGSMQAIYRPALSGVNETLQTIREADKEHKEQKHFVSLITFDTGHYNEIYQRTPADKAIDITEDQYRPCGGTPLYDAMGRAITDLRQHTGKDDVVLVTVITDGYENASREYTGRAIKSLVDEMKLQGWVFTYIGANQDVEAVAEAMSIDNRMAFDASDTGTKAMFEKELACRRTFFSKISKSQSIRDISDDYFKD